MYNNYLENKHSESTTNYKRFSYSEFIKTYHAHIIRVGKTINIYENCKIQNIVERFGR